jgi:hypothetical protein
MKFDGLSERGDVSQFLLTYARLLLTTTLSNKDTRGDVTTVVIPPLLVSFGVFIDIDIHNQLLYKRAGVRVALAFL